MSIAPREDRWQEKYNRSNEFYQKHGHTKVTYSNCEDKKMVDWVTNQRRCCKMEKRRKMRSMVKKV